MQITTIGLDLAKNVFQVHGVDEVGKLTVTRRLRRGQLIGFLICGDQYCIVLHG
jgi:transposase